MPHLPQHAPGRAEADGSSRGGLRCPTQPSRRVEGRDLERFGLVEHYSSLHLARVPAAPTLRPVAPRLHPQRHRRRAHRRVRALLHP